MLLYLRLCWSFQSHNTIIGICWLRHAKKHRPCYEELYIYIVESWTTILYIPTPHVVGLGSSQIDEQAGSLEITKENKSII